VGTYHLDYHWPDRVERAGTGITTMVEPYHIPLRSLVPRGGKNLLVAGRSASGDQMAMSSFRIQATCAQMGFAAGKAALVCLREERDLQDAPIDSIQQEIEAGAARSKTSPSLLPMGPDSPELHWKRALGRSS